MSHLDSLISWCEEESQLDIYQVNAFYIGTGSRQQYCIAFLKLISCFGLQTAGIFLLVSIQWAEVTQQSASPQCVKGPIGRLSVMAYFFSTFVSVIISEKLRGLGDKGMYSWKDNQPIFVSKLWIGLGFLTNIFVLILSWGVSLIVIFISTDILDMVLNGVAVLFMIELDEDIVSFMDYQTIKGVGSYTEQTNIGCIADAFGLCLLKISYLWKYPVILAYLLYPFVLGLPFFVLYCFDEPPLGT